MKGFLCLPTPPVNLRQTLSFRAISSGEGGSNACQCSKTDKTPIVEVVGHGNSPSLGASRQYLYFFTRRQVQTPIVEFVGPGRSPEDAGGKRTFVPVKQVN